MRAVCVTCLILMYLMLISNRHGVRPHQRIVISIVIIIRLRRTRVMVLLTPIGVRLIGTTH